MAKKRTADEELKHITKRLMDADKRVTWRDPATQYTCTAMTLHPDDRHAAIVGAVQIPHGHPYEGLTNGAAVIRELEMRHDTAVTYAGPIAAMARNQWWLSFSMTRERVNALYVCVVFIPEFLVVVEELAEQLYLAEHRL